MITDEIGMAMNKKLNVDGYKITKRYIVIYYKGAYEFYDISLDEVIFTGIKSEMEIFIDGFICGRTTQN